jgi:hypothetical protein
MLALAIVSAAAVMTPQPALAETRTAAASVDARSGAAPGSGTLQLAAVDRSGRTGPGGFVSCPEGYHLSPFEMPIYDADGRFVVGYETVRFCIPDDLEPAG